MKFLKIAVAAALLSAGLTITTPALADGEVRCNGGPRESWRPIAELRRRAWREGWTIQETRIEGDCYEVYARTETGQAIEAFFHPVTLQKLVVYRRGQQIYRAPGFAG